MSAKTIFILVVVIMVCIALIAISSITIQAYNDNSDYKKNNPKKFDFAVAMLVSSIIIIILCIAYIVYIIKTGQISSADFRQMSMGFGRGQMQPFDMNSTRYPISPQSFMYSDPNSPYETPEGYEN